MSVAVILLNQVSIFDQKKNKYLFSFLFLIICVDSIFFHTNQELTFIGNVSKQGKHLIQMGNQIKKINIQMGKISSKRNTTEKKNSNVYELQRELESTSKL